MTETERQLQRIADALERIASNGTALAAPALPPATRMTFGEWLTVWQEKYRRQRQNSETYAQNVRRIKDDIIPTLGDTLLTELTTDQLQDFINGYAVSNARDKIGHILNGSLRKAAEVGHIPRNPYNAVESVKSRSNSFPVLQPKTQLKLISAITSPKYLQMFMFYCCTGFRLSEGLSINPKNDIDRKRHVISLAMPDQKTKKHRREVPYLPELLNGFDLTKSTLFPDITRNAARLYFSKLFKANKVNAVFHSFRHTFISCCYHVGIPDKHIQQWAGHSSIVMTMDTYTHILEQQNTPIIDYLRQLKKRLKI